MIDFLANVSTYPVIPDFFHLTLVKNTGVAFGLLKGYSIPVTLATFVIIAALFWSLWRRVEARGTLFLVSFGLVLGGAVGNLIDRFRFGGVIDFLDFRVWPVFNVADSCITVGALFLAWQMLRYN
ncbi:MAG: signal peptidase II [Candidatus Omnitrophica bacterium]|nr:signal peptidase II [Candidatus Omnitrophota bacterium]